MKIVLFGCGKMGRAMLNGWLDNGLSADDVVIVETNETVQSSLISAKMNVVSDLSLVDVNFIPDVVFFAVKPQMVEAVASASACLAKHKPLFISIAAGKKIEQIASYIGNPASIVRVMPNTPAAVRQGVLVACANPLVNENNMKQCAYLLDAVGKTIWIDDEKQMDAVTAVSGNGPAYIFALVEAMTEAGIAAGLAPELATELARGTVCGSAELLRQSNETATVLRNNVTTPNGTTAAALKVLLAEKNGLAELMTTAVLAGKARSEELGRA